MITVSGLKKTFCHGRNAIQPLKGLDFTCRRGEYVLVTGRSGSGKTTFLNILGGLARPSEGTVLLSGQDLYRISGRERAALRSTTIGFVFQFPGLLPPLTTLENVVLPCTFTGKKPGRIDRGLSLLARVGLEEKAHYLPGSLSGGELRRAAIARAFINNPPIILADEPTSDLDEESEREVMGLFREFHAAGTTIVMVTHNSDLAAYASRVMRMDHGRLSKIVIQ